MENTKFVRHLFMPGHTIVAAIRLHNKQDVTPEEMVELQQRFCELNGNQVQRPGQSALIPILKRHEA